ncbi:MAG TPA: DNA methyltransferase, partial [Draconibacterium sp.]|nr:DNA methyltransferase [Draconibacterium sp.]
MALGWNEIKERAVRFSKEWKDAFNEEADAKQFLIEFFNVFGISNRRVATFEHRVKKLGETDGYIDLLWKGTLLIEMKSRGKNLDKAYKQSIDYTYGLKETELPKYILVSDFANLRLYDLEKPEGEEFVEFKLEELVKYVKLFGFIAGYQKHDFKVEEAVNIEAAYHMGVLHDALKDSGYTGRDLEIYLVRLLFCLFADDTGIFERGIFLEYLNQKTNTDGSDLGMHLAQLFQVLNTTTEKRQKTLDESLAQFPYINGHLFEQQLSFASFNSRMRATLLQCCILDWNKISPAIFGSMFQSVMNEIERRNLGAHYTSEKNILKVIKPLFLDALWQEFAAAKSSIGKLKAFHKKVASLRFLDPACGCGNFLVITYRELRLLELAILKELQRGQMVHDISQLVLCDVDRFYGIEYEEFPAQIAQVALWLTDHQMNMMVSAEFGEYFVRLPLKKSAKITHGNALRTDWGSLVEPLPWETANRFDYVFGNPPFVGKQLQNPEQKSDMELIFKGVNGAGVFDYVTAWYIKAAKYLQENNPEEISNDRKTRVAFVST